MYLNVKAELARQNLSVVDLSNKTGIRYQTLAEKLNGKYPLTLDEAKKIKAALGVDLSMEELFAKNLERR
jgi:lambda repressor-like predicted transcriptional regulator